MGARYKVIVLYDDGSQRPYPREDAEWPDRSDAYLEARVASETEPGYVTAWVEMTLR